VQDLLKGHGLAPVDLGMLMDNGGGMIKDKNFIQNNPLRYHKNLSYYLHILLLVIFSLDHLPIVDSKHIQIIYLHIKHLEATMLIINFLITTLAIKLLHTLRQKIINSCITILLLTQTARILTITIPRIILQLAIIIKIKAEKAITNN